MDVKGQKKLALLFDWQSIKMHTLLTLNSWRLAMTSLLYWVGGIGVYVFGTVVLYGPVLASSSLKVHFYFFVSQAFIFNWVVAWHILWMRACMQSKNSTYMFSYMMESMLLLLPITYIMGAVHYYKFLWLLLPSLLLINIFTTLFFLDSYSLAMPFTENVYGFAHTLCRFAVSLYLGIRMFFKYISWPLWLLFHGVLVVWYLYDYTFLKPLGFLGILLYIVVMLLWPLIFYGFLTSSAVTLYLQYAYGSFEMLQQYSVNHKNTQ